jgi:hypothetical protein
MTPTGHRGLCATGKFQECFNSRSVSMRGLVLAGFRADWPDLKMQVAGFE